jgi:hypothetical protein
VWFYFSLVLSVFSVFTRFEFSFGSHSFHFTISSLYMLSLGLVYPPKKLDLVENKTHITLFNYEVENAPKTNLISDETEGLITLVLSVACSSLVSSVVYFSLVSSVVCYSLVSSVVYPSLVSSVVSVSVILPKSSLFSSFTFLLSREVPNLSLFLILRNCGARVILLSNIAEKINEETYESILGSVTHMIIDRYKLYSKRVNEKLHSKRVKIEFTLNTSKE